MKLKTAGNVLLQIVMEMDAYDTVLAAINAGHIVSACSIDEEGVADALFKMASGDGLGIRLNMEYSLEELFRGEVGELLVECTPEGADEVFKTTLAKVLGIVTEEAGIVYRNTVISIDEALNNKYS